jgi:TPR repeat protein
VSRTVEQINFAACVEQGDDVDTDLGNVRRSRNALDEYSYGFCFEHGMGVDIDLRMTMHYYQSLADHGNRIGHCNYSLYLEQGRGVR